MPTPEVHGEPLAHQQFVVSNDSGARRQDPPQSKLPITVSADRRTGEAFGPLGPAITQNSAKAAQAFNEFSKFAGTAWGILPPEAQNGDYVSPVMLLLSLVPAGKVVKYFSAVQNIVGRISPTLAGSLQKLAPKALVSAKDVEIVEERTGLMRTKAGNEGIVTARISRKNGVYSIETFYKGQSMGAGYQLGNPPIEEVRKSLQSWLSYLEDAGLDFFIKYG